MSKRAIDIVILPPQEITDLAIRYNTRIREHDNKIVLDHDNVLPHVSVAMGCVDEEGMEQLTLALGQVVQNFHSFPVRINEFTGTQLAIEHTDKLQEFHEAIMDAITYIVDQDIDEDMVGPPPNPTGEFPGTDFTINYVYSFREKRAYENYSPHITCGLKATVPSEQLDIKFPVERIAVCKLGGYCTCHDILWETKLPLE